jgi:hypothetical protein
VEQNKPSLESTLKSSDTEEFIDIHFYRPIGYRLALLFRDWGVTPNMVTIASIFIGIASGVCFYFEQLWVSILGIFLLIWANAFDSTDGQLARMTQNFSPVGRALDGFAGDLWFASIYIAISLRLEPVFDFYIWIMAIAAGFFHSKQAAMADYYRNIHLLFLKGKSGSELDNTDELTVRYKRESFRNNCFNKLYLLFYRSYTRSQENWTPYFQEMFRLLKQKHGETFPEKFRTDFRRLSLPLMKWTNVLSFNTRAIVLFIAILVNLPWIYFVFELTVLNIILIYTVAKHEKISKQFTDKLELGVY